MPIALFPCVLVFRSQAAPARAFLDRSGLLGFCPARRSICLVSAGVPDLYGPFKLTGQAEPAVTIRQVAIQLAERGIILNEAPAAPGAFEALDFAAEQFLSGVSDQADIDDPSEDTFEGKVNALIARGQLTEDFESINLALTEMRLH